MKWYILVLCLITGSITFCLAESDFLKDALDSDRAMSEIHKEFQLIGADMAGSNVFDSKDLEENIDFQKRMEETRVCLRTDVIQALEESIQNQKDVSGHYVKAYKGYTKVITSLNDIAAKAKETGREGVAYDLISKLETLCKEVEKLVEKELANMKLSDTELDAYDKLARDASDISVEMPAQNIKDLVSGAGKDLGRKDAITALKKLKDAIKALQGETKQEDNAVSDLYSKQAELDKMMDDIKENIKDIKDLDGQTKSDEAMNAMIKMEETRNNLEENGMKDAAQNVQEAQQDMQQGKAEEALQQLQDALTDIKTEKDAVAKDIADKMAEQTDLLSTIDALEQQIKSIDQLANAVNDLQQDQQDALKSGDQQGQEQADQQAAAPQGEAKMEAGTQKELADAMNQLGEEMTGQELGEAAKDMNAAGEQTEKAQHGDAAQSMEQAKADLQTAMDKAMGQLAAAQQELAQGGQQQGEQQGQPQDGQQQAQQAQQPGQPMPGKPGDKPGKEDDGKGRPVSAADLVARQPGGDWHSRLPESERQALLAARKENCTPEMSDAVKQYYINLAK